MAGLGLNMNILVSNINHRGQKDLSFEIRHKAYAFRYVQAFKTKNIKNMKRIILIFIGLTLIFISCNKNENETNEKSFNATVQGKGLDCGNSFLIKFDKNVSGLPENSFDNTFYEINLPEEFKVEGKKVYVEFRELENDEMITCTTMGIGYPQIYIMKVE